MFPLRNLHSTAFARVPGGMTHGLRLRLRRQGCLTAVVSVPYLRIKQLSASLKRPPICSAMVSISRFGVIAKLRALGLAWVVLGGREECGIVNVFRHRGKL